MQHPSLPPLYTLAVLEDGDTSARERACALAAGGAGAGHFVWAARQDRFDCAVVLRPEEAPDKARPAVLVAALALFDAVGAVAPAGLNADLAWPGLLRVNGGVAGGITLRDGPVAADGALEWLVAAARLRMDMQGGQESGDRPDITWLRQEGCAEVATHALAEAFARYLLSWMDRWDNDGFEPVRRNWLHRATANGGDAVLTLGGELIAGTIEGLDDTGGLILDTSAGRRVLPLARALDAEIEA